MAEEPVKWWQYQAEVLDYAARMHGEGHSWDAIAVHLCRRGQCPYYHPEFLGGAVLARRAAKKRDEDRPPEISRDGRLTPCRCLLETRRQRCLRKKQDRRPT